jgi:hypothetical protein
VLTAPGGWEFKIQAARYAWLNWSYWILLVSLLCGFFFLFFPVKEFRFEAVFEPMTLEKTSVGVVLEAGRRCG